MVFMDMAYYEGVNIHEFMPGDNGGISVAYSVIFNAESPVTNHTLNRHLMQKIDGNGHLMGTDFQASIGMRGKSNCGFKVAKQFVSTNFGKL